MLKTCIICGTEFETKYGKVTCSKRCYNQSRKKTKVCKECGKPFLPTPEHRKYCPGPHYDNCVICGKQFEYDPMIPSRSKCCSKECTEKLRERTMEERFGVPFASQSKELRDKVVKTNLEKFGVEVPAQNEDVKAKMHKTCKDRYGTHTPLLMDGFRDMSKETCLTKYGVEYTGQIESAKRKRQATNMRKYGSTYPLGNPDIRGKASRGSTPSSLERRLFAFLDEYGIRYEMHHVVSIDGCSHEFDVYIPDHEILVDCDGVYFHGYLNDPDGKFSDMDRDARRGMFVKRDQRFLVIVESDFEHGLNELRRMLEATDGSILEYESDLFKWCRELGFPYPDYSDTRIRKDYEKLCILDPMKASKNNWVALSSIRQFHKSLWECRVGSNPSIREAWEDDDTLKKVIANRLIYKDDVDPSKVLAGFYISKIVPKVSVFRPALAKRLVTQYLNEFDSVFDPFSGFSGRMLGVCAAGKHYIGQDLRKASIAESKEIRDFHGIDAELSVKDLFEARGNYECLLTCPPYGGKERYQFREIQLDSDLWVSECLKRFDCNRYVFVVDDTDIFGDFVVETLHGKSHMRKSDEYVLVIDRDAVPSNVYDCGQDVWEHRKGRCSAY